VVAGTFLGTFFDPQIAVQPGFYLEANVVRSCYVEERAMNSLECQDLSARNARRIEYLPMTSLMQIVGRFNRDADYE
jgi:hypothetical protein